jgi:hypothetical protein
MTLHRNRQAAPICSTILPLTTVIAQAMYHSDRGIAPMRASWFPCGPLEIEPQRRRSAEVLKNLREQIRTANFARCGIIMTAATPSPKTSMKHSFCLHPHSRSYCFWPALCRLRRRRRGDDSFQRHHLPGGGAVHRLADDHEDARWRVAGGFLRRSRRAYLPVGHYANGAEPG